MGYLALKITLQTKFAYSTKTTSNFTCGGGLSKYTETLESTSKENLRAISSQWTQYPFMVGGTACTSGEKVIIFKAHG